MNKNNNPKSDVSFYFYLNPNKRRLYTEIYDEMLENYNKTYQLLYSEIVEHTEEVYQRYLNEAEELIDNYYFNEDDDGSGYYDVVQEYAYSKVKNKLLMHYQFSLMSISNLYQVFEQQLRGWLFEEITHQMNCSTNTISVQCRDSNKYGSFLSDINKIRTLFKNLQFYLREELLNDFMSIKEKELVIGSEVWLLIEECNLISNIFKHGDGHSANKLRSLKPDYFLKVSEKTLKIDLYLTTNFEQALNVEKIYFSNYISAIKEFWSRIPEYQTLTGIIENKILLGK